MTTNSALKTLRINFHDDPDWKLSAYWINKFFSKKFDRVILTACNYSKPLNDSGWTKSDTVIIVDFSFDLAEMEYLNNNYDLHWIDHHKSAIEKMAPIAAKIQGLRTTKMAGCELSYLYGLNSFKNFLNVDLNRELISFQFPVEIPFATSQIGLFDSWRFPKEETARFETLGLCLNLLPENPLHPDWEIVEDDDAFEEWFQKSSKVIRTFVLSLESQIEKAGFEVKVNGFKGFAYNHQFAGTPWIPSLFSKYDFVWRFAFSKDHWSNSLYSQESINGLFDCSIIAKQLGVDNGGGHSGAGGFKSLELLATDYVIKV